MLRIKNDSGHCTEMGVCFDQWKCEENYFLTASMNSCIVHCEGSDLFVIIFSFLLRKLK